MPRKSARRCLISNLRASFTVAVLSVVLAEDSENNAVGGSSEEFDFCSDPEGEWCIKNCIVCAEACAPAGALDIRSAACANSTAVDGGGCLSSCLVCVQYLACPSISTYVEDFVNKTLEATSGEADGSNGDNHDDAGVVFLNPFVNDISSSTTNETQETMNAPADITLESKSVAAILGIVAASVCIFPIGGAMWICILVYKRREADQVAVLVPGRSIQAETGRQSLDQRLNLANANASQYHPAVLENELELLPTTSVAPNRGERHASRAVEECALGASYPMQAHSRLGSQTPPAFELHAVICRGEGHTPTNLHAPDAAGDGDVIRQGATAAFAARIDPYQARRVAVRRKSASKSHTSSSTSSSRGSTAAIEKRPVGSKDVPSPSASTAARHPNRHSASSGTSGNEAEAEAGPSLPGHIQETTFGDAAASTISSSEVNNSSGDASSLVGTDPNIRSPLKNALQRPIMLPPMQQLTQL